MLQYVGPSAHITCTSKREFWRRCVVNPRIKKNNPSLQVRTAAPVRSVVRFVDGPPRVDTQLRIRFGIMCYHVGRYIVEFEIFSIDNRASTILYTIPLIIIINTDYFPRASYFDGFLCILLYSSFFLQLLSAA